MTTVAMIKGNSRGASVRGRQRRRSQQLWLWHFSQSYTDDGTKTSACLEIHPQLIEQFHSKRSMSPLFFELIPDKIYSS